MKRCLICSRWLWRWQKKSSYKGIYWHSRHNGEGGPPVTEEEAWH